MEIVAGIVIFLLSALGSIILTALFQDAADDLVAKVLPGKVLVGKYRKFRGRWEISYTKDGSDKKFVIDLKQINGKVWGTSEIEPTLNVTYKLLGKLKGDKLSGVWHDINPISAFHGVYFVDSSVAGDKAEGTVLSEDNAKKVVSCPTTWLRI